jgi:hypothetical protein
MRRVPPSQEASMLSAVNSQLAGVRSHTGQSMGGHKPTRTVSICA